MFLVNMSFKYLGVVEGGYSGRFCQGAVFLDGDVYGYYRGTANGSDVQTPFMIV